jgi:flagellar biosynthetic protein FliS
VNVIGLLEGFAMMNKANVYQAQQILTSPPQKLVTFLYNRAILELKAAKAKPKWEERNSHLKMVTEIFLQLMRGCDRRMELGENLYRLYDFYMRYLLVGQIRKEEERIDQTLKFLEEIRDVWEEARLKAAKETQAP